MRTAQPAPGPDRSKNRAFCRHVQVRSLSMKRQTKERNFGPKVQTITIVAKAICVHLNIRSRSSGIRGQRGIGFKILKSGLLNEVLQGWSLHYFIHSVLSFFGFIQSSIWNLLNNEVPGFSSCGCSLTAHVGLTETPDLQLARLTNVTKPGPSVRAVLTSTIYPFDKEGFHRALV
ncbi:hypothetical protein CABS01_07435 [Colletotrichum abscissum]|uniref:uncharacterized protein n=1 Tax=Colletotrichum abscissum TaxID=1671311 RepID=UPI0027D49A2B|nr:uncharacterized protein CABS01_07435 [Colletotrichum abscissum]KAK1511477.1 hypothetical protein CABS01_07435 [Colletotrichum abscissum]